MSVKILGVTVGLPVVAVATYLIAKNVSKPPMPTNIKMSPTRPTPDIVRPKPTDPVIKQEPYIIRHGIPMTREQEEAYQRRKAEAIAKAKAESERRRKLREATTINPVKMMSLTVDLGRLNEQDINLVKSMLTNRDGYDMKLKFKGHTVWDATYVPRNMKISSVGMNVPSNTSKRLQVWAHVNNPNQPHFDFNARNRGNYGKESLISGGVYEVRDGRGNLGNTTGASLEFTFGDGRLLRFAMGHQETKVTDKYGGSGKMSIQHFYGPNTTNFKRNNSVYLRLPDGTSRQLA